MGKTQAAATGIIDELQKPDKATIDCKNLIQYAQDNLSDGDPDRARAFIAAARVRSALSDLEYKKLNLVDKLLSFNKELIDLAVPID